MQKDADRFAILLSLPLLTPILLAIGGYFMADYIFGQQRFLSIIAALFVGALGLSVLAAWSLYMMDDEKTGTAGQERVQVGTLFRLGTIALAIICLLAALLFIYHGVQVRSYLLILTGLLAALFCSLTCVATFLRILGLRVNVLVPVVTGLIIAGGLAGYIAVATRVAVDPACYGRGVAAAAVYDEGPGPHPVEVLHYGSRIWDPVIPTTWFSALPESWRPDSVADTELVACVSSVQEYKIETCRYTGADITRYGYARSVILISTRNGEIIASRRFEGEPPRQCQQTEEITKTSLRGGKLIDPDDVWDWLGAYVEPDLDREAGPELDDKEPVTEAPEVPEVPETLPEVPVAEPVEEVRPVEVEPEAIPQVRPEPTEIRSIQEVAPAAEESPASLVTPASDPPVIGVLIGNPSMWSGPKPGGEHMGIILEEGEQVEMLASTDEWTEVRWLSPEGNEVTGWIQSRWVRPLDD